MATTAGALTLREGADALGGWWPRWGATAGSLGGAGGSFDFVDEFVLGFDDVEGGFSCFLSKGTDHDDGPWRIVQDTLEDFEAAEVRHIDVEGDDVGLEPVDLREGLGSSLGSNGLDRDAQDLGDQVDDKAEYAAGALRIRRAGIHDPGGLFFMAASMA